VAYYKNIAKIVNNDQQTYYVYLKVENPATGLPQGSKLILYIYNANAGRSLSGWPQPTPTSGSYMASLDLTTSGSTTSKITLSSQSSLELDVYVYIPEGTTLPSSPVTAQLLLVYTPSTETPP